MRKERSRERCSAAWAASSSLEEERSSSMKSVSFLRRRRLLCCVFCKSANLSGWVVIAPFELTCGRLLLPIDTCKRRLPPVPFEATCFIDSTSSHLQCHPCGNT